MKKVACGIVALVIGCSAGADVPIVMHITSGSQTGLTIDYQIGGNVLVQLMTLYRSYVDLNSCSVLNLYEQPITKKIYETTPLRGRLVDSLVADNCTYYYYMKARLINGVECFSTIVSGNVPDREFIIAEKKQPVIFVDKINYFLELRFDSITVKRYPVSLGGNPVRRKLYYDRQSTPEGTYKIAFLKPKSDFYKSIGVSYPNPEDRRRYAAAQKAGELPVTDGKTPHIGGSITIHGGGIGNNWTWGCIAMRNHDLNEVFSLPNLKPGTPILICGYEVGRDALK